MEHNIDTHNITNLGGGGAAELQLGIPTANIPVDGLEVLNEIGNGIYFGFAGVDIDAHGRRLPPVIGNAEASGEKKEEQECGRVWPMVMSIGLNPFYKNEVRSVVRYIPLHLVHQPRGGSLPLTYSQKKKKKKQEVHLITPQPIENDFYGAQINCLVLGFIRPELDFESLEALVRDILTDIEVAKISLERDMWREVGKKEKRWLLGF